MAKASVLTVAKVGEALIEARGIVTAAAVILGCSPQTVRRMLAKKPELKELQAEARTFMLDEAEEQLLKKAREGNVTACVFLYRMLAEQRREKPEAKPGGKRKAAAENALLEELPEVTDEELQQALANIEDDC
jgi:hypothetical protein